MFSDVKIRVIPIQMMRVNEACNIFHIKMNVLDQIDASFIRRQYRKLSLKYHPDKNTHCDTTEQFRSLSIARELLETYLEQDENDEEDDDEDDENNELEKEEQKYVLALAAYKKRIREFLKSMLGDNVLDALTQVCQKKVICMAQTLDPNLLRPMYVILKKNQLAWEISDEFLEAIERTYD